MYDNFKIGDLVFAKNRQTIFNFSNNPGSGLEDSVLDETKGLGVVVDFNPLITQGHLKTQLHMYLQGYYNCQWENLYCQ